MQGAYDSAQSYSWHQSHDQATVLLLVPYDTEDDDVNVIFDGNYLVAGVGGQAPIVKGRLYGRIDIPNSSWQLEPRTSHLPPRERTTSTTSTTSTHSSFAYVSEADLSSALNDADFSDALASPALSSPVSLTVDDLAGSPFYNPGPGPGIGRRRATITASPRPTISGPSSIPSSFSSMESLHDGAGRLLTIHVEKAESMIWPSLVVGPVPETLSPSHTAGYPWVPEREVENAYNMDPTSLVLIALDLSDIRDDAEEAFEYFIRAWHRAHMPSATIRLASHYLPLNAVSPDLLLSLTTNAPTTPTSESPSSPSFTPTTPVPGSSSTSSIITDRTTYYLTRLGGAPALAQLYLEAGLLFLEGTASSLLSSSYAGLSSLRTPTQPQTHIHANAADAWRRDQDYARRFFDRARRLRPELDVPLLASRTATPPTPEHELQMPTIDVSKPASADMSENHNMRRRRRREEAEDLVRTGPPSSVSAVEERASADDEDNTWYLYLPGIVGAGTALLVVGFLSFSSWRKGQGS
ncbi:hypothetical protein BDW22DRAFT_1352117 [Trametopsis cervina]|nr:hypothetical protein BDW22DRAFT_1352117 [Trametopsis cervina]